MVKTSLKSVLRNFLNHYETLESRHKLCQEDDLYLREFQALKELTESLKNDSNCRCLEGEKDVNRRKNRYKDILPYDHSRVIISEYPGVPGSDYINANYVKGSSGSTCAYIASQGPLPNTVVDFWRMIWECDVSVIVMACNEREAGKYKCESYWPEENEEQQQYGNITVEIVKWRQVCPDFLVRTFRVKADSSERTVCQFHYTTWPDHGVPTSVHPILELVRLMRDVQVSESRPLLIHCSAGCGRTGTICSIDYVWALLRTGKLRNDFSLHNIISDMRRQRIAMVQTVEQYMLCYKAVATLFEQQLKMIDTHTYENIDEDGEPLILREISSEDTDGAQSSESSLREDNVKKLIENHNLHNNKSETNNMIHLPNNMIHLPNNMNHLPNNMVHTDEIRQERLIGKATVIRRPSIAKLKAIFENQIVNQHSVDTLTRNRVTTGGTLQRSQSTKVPSNNRSQENEEINRDNNNDGAHIQNVQINNEQPFSYHKSNKIFNKDDSQNYSQQNNGPNVDQEQRFSNNNVFTIQSTYSHSLHNNINQINIVQHPPPKPPRTYQHILNDNETLYEVPSNSNGRLIVSIALPKRQTNETTISTENIYEPLVRRCNVSAPNLMINSNDLTSISNQTKEMKNQGDGLNGNNTIYETIIHQNVIPPNMNNNAYFDVIRMNNGNRTLPIYEAIASRRNFVQNPILTNFQSKVTVPSQIQTAFNPRPTYENIYSIGNCKIANSIQSNLRPTVTYVKPKPINNFNVNVNNSIVIKESSNNMTKSSSSQTSQPTNNKTNSKSKRDQKSANHQNSQHQTNNSSFSLFSNTLWGFRKKKSPKNKNKTPTVTTIQSNSGNSANNAQTIRPPHSHRFSPPTQWTQV